MKKEVITLSGELGAGKSTTTKLLVEKLGYERIYTGAIFRQRAEDLGLSLHDFSKLAEQDPQHDHYVDDKLKEFLAKDSQIVCDSFLSPWFAPHSFKVFLDIDPVIAAERMFEDQKNNPNRKTEDYGSIEEQLEKNKARRASNVKRYNDLYDVENYLDKNHFDLIIDTTNISPSDVVSKIVTAYQSWLTQ